MAEQILADDLINSQSVLRSIGYYDEGMESASFEEKVDFLCSNFIFDEDNPYRPEISLAWRNKFYLVDEHNIVDVSKEIQPIACLSEYGDPYNVARFTYPIEPEIVRAAVRKEPYVLEAISECPFAKEYNDALYPEVLDSALRKDGMLLEFIPQDLLIRDFRENNNELCKTAIRRDVMPYLFIPKNRNEQEFMMTADEFKDSNIRFKPSKQSCVDMGIYEILMRHAKQHPMIYEVVPYEKIPGQFNLVNAYLNNADDIRSFESFLYMFEPALLQKEDKFYPEVISSFVRFVKNHPSLRITEKYRKDMDMLGELAVSGVRWAKEYFNKFHYEFMFGKPTGSEEIAYAFQYINALEDNMIKQFDYIEKRRDTFDRNGNSMLKPRDYLIIDMDRLGFDDILVQLSDRYPKVVTDLFCLKDLLMFQKAIENPSLDYVPTFDWDANPGKNATEMVMYDNTKLDIARIGLNNGKFSYSYIAKVAYPNGFSDPNVANEFALVGINKDPQNLQYIKNPSLQVIYHALDKDPTTFVFVEADRLNKEDWILYGETAVAIKPAFVSHYENHPALEDADIIRIAEKCPSCIGFMSPEHQALVKGVVGGGSGNTGDATIGERVTVQVKTQEISGESR